MLVNIVITDNLKMTGLQTSSTRALTRLSTAAKCATGSHAPSLIRRLATVVDPGHKVAGTQM